MFEVKKKKKLKIESPLKFKNTDKNINICKNKTLNRYTVSVLVLLYKCNHYQLFYNPKY